MDMALVSPIILCLFVYRSAIGQSLIARKCPEQVGPKVEDFFENEVRRQSREIEDLKMEIAKLRSLYSTIAADKQQNPSVAFTATTSRNIWTTYWDRLRVVIFDYVITNVGGAYNSTTGIFTAPGSGNYCFSWTTLTLNGYSFESKLYRNGFEVYPLYSHANAKQDDLDSSSNLVSLSLSKGDRIWIVYISGGFLDTGASSFSGWKF